MSRTYLRAAGLTAVGFLAAGLSQESTARALFDSAAVSEEHFAVLAQPIGKAQWKLLVLEQIKTQPRCWRARQDGLVEPSLNRFNFSSICKRYLDSNGYSLRSVAKTLNPLRFRLKPSGASLRLEALDPHATGTTPGGSGSFTSSPRSQRVRGSAAGAGLGLGTPGLPGSPVEPPVLRASRPGEPAARAGQQPRPAFRLSAVGSADAADRTTAVANGTSNTAANYTPTHHTPGQQCPDPAAGDSLSPLRTNRHSAS